VKRYVPEWLRKAARRCVRDGDRRSEAGDTLLEVLIALVVLSVASVALLVSFATSISASSTYRDVATLDTVLRTASEEVITQIQQQPAALFQSCAGAANVTFSLPTGYTAAITAVSYWTGASFVTSCVPNAEQWITLSVTETQNGQSATNNFIVDDPLARPIVTPGNATQLVYIEQPGNASINTAFTPEPVVAIEDASGNIVTTDLSPVTLTITPGTGTSGAKLSASCSGTEFYGVVTFSSCTIDTAGQGYTLTATDGSLSPATSSAFSVSSGVATQLVFASQPGNSSGGSTLTVQPVVDVEDANGILVTTDNSTVALAVTPGSGSSGASLSGCTQTESAGVITFSGCAVSLAGNGYTLTASDGSLASATSTSFNVAVGAASNLVFTTQPTGSASGTMLSTQPVIKVEDPAGNVVTSASTAITLTASGGSLSSCSGLSAVSGIVNVAGCNFSGLVGTDYTLSASASGLITGTSTYFNVTVGQPTKLVFTTATSGVASQSATSMFTTQPVVSVEDSAGNVVTTFASPVTLAISSGETLSCTSGTTLVPRNGVITFSGCAGNAYASDVTLSAMSSGLTSATNTSFDISNVATQLAFTAQPSNIAEGLPMAPPVVVSVEDATGIVVTTSNASISLSIGSNPGSATLAGTTPITAVSGTAMFSNLSFNALGTGYTLDASSSGLTPVVSSSFNVIVGAPIKLVITTQPVASASGTAFSTQPVVQVEDSAGNLVTNASMAIALTTSGGTLASCTGLSAVSGVVNVASCTFAGLLGTNYTLTASASGLAPATSSNFSPTNFGSAAKLVFTTEPTSGASGAVFSTQPVVKVEDSAGNVVTNASTTIALAASGGTLASCSGLSAVSGVVHVANCTFAGLVGTNYTLSASASGFISATSSNFSPSSPGSATKLVFLIQPASATSGAILSTQPVINVEDSAGNVVTNASTTITLTASGGTLASCSGLSAVSGVVNVANCTFAGLVGTNYTLSASANGLTSSTSSTFSPSTFGSATKLVFTTQPVGSASGTALPTQPVVQVEDSAGNVVTNASTTITLTASGGTLASCSGLSAVSGVVNVANCTFAGLVNTNYTLIASASGLTSATSTTFTVTFGAPNKLVFTTQPVGGASNATLSTQPVVKIEDSEGNVVTNASTAITLTTSGGTLASCSGLSAVSGVVNVTKCTLTGLVNTNYTLSASASGLTSATSNTFTVTFGAATKLVFTTQPVGGASGATLSTQPVVKVEDSAGNVVTNASTAITLTASSGTLASCSGLSAISGVVNVTNCTFAGLVNTNYTLSASAGGLTSATSTPFTVTFGAAAKLVFTTQPVGGASGAVLSTEPVVKVEDSAGNVVTNASMTITLSASGGTLAACSGLSAVSGVVNVTKCTIAGLVNTNYTLSASTSGLTSATSTTFTVTFGAATTLVFSTQTNGVASSSATTAFTTQPVVKVEDSAGNVVTNYASSVSLTISSGETLSCTAGTSKTPTSGVVTFSGCAGTAYASGVTLTAASSGLTSLTSASFDISNVATQLVFSVQPSNATHGSTITPPVVVSVEDSSGRVVTTSTASIATAIGTGTGTLSGTTTVTALNGVSTFSTLVISARGTGDTLVATSSGLTSATSSAFTES
jgi:hypothetical protein